MEGLSVFVNDAKYKKFLATHIEQPQVSTCESEHDAIVKASTSRSPGYSILGKGLALCTCHLLVQKNGVGDLQKGERYCNMDYIVFSALCSVQVPQIFITYDIACQWLKNLNKRMTADKFPPELKINNKTSLKFAIPSWHINGHGQSCCKNFNIGYTKGAAKTCGEEPEVSWLHTNPLAASLREMGEGAQHETLNDHYMGWNFRCVVSLRTHLSKHIKEAHLMKICHEGIYSQMCKTFTPSVITQWTNMVEKWEKDSSSPNPFHVPDTNSTLNDICLAISKEEAKEVADKGVDSSSTSSVTLFFTTAFDFEERLLQPVAVLAPFRGKYSKISTLPGCNIFAIS
ncbi:hypothetical protein BJ165DRAFT_1535713 [Panaeolus papilionaceus]|nr:hypothetical protein BJ165DRAFT_1535713 [Panaeolus papilionaceus]